MVGETVRVVCGKCGSELVTRDAWTVWDADRQQWVVGAFYPSAFCHRCESETEVREVAR